MYVIIICRWNESVVSFLPEYLRALYIKTLINFKEIEDTMEPFEKYRMAYIIKQVCYQIVTVIILATKSKEENRTLWIRAPCV